VQECILIREAQDGNHSAFEQLVHAHDRAVLRLAFRITGSQSDAQDIYQEVFLRAYKKLGGFPSECSFSTWIYRITTIACLNYLRQNNREHSAREVKLGGNNQWSLLNDASNEGSATDLEQRLRRERIEQILFALQRLTPRERMVVELKHFQGLKLRTVSEILDISDRSVATSLFRATQKLRFSLLGSAKDREHR
jgi:RNA polymerase sigma-70 factor (ECF subfamily)